MIELFARHGDIYRVYVPIRRSYTYVIHHPDDVKRVLVSNHRNYTKGTGIDRIKLLLGKGIMTSEGELWKRQRSLMQPCFHRRVVTEFVARHRARQRPLHRALGGAAARGERVNVTEEMSELTLEIVLRSILGRDRDRLSAAARRQSVRGGGQGAARNLQFVYKFRSLGKVLLELIARRRAATRRGALRLPRHADERARQGERRADERW